MILGDPHGGWLQVTRSATAVHQYREVLGRPCVLNGQRAATGLNHVWIGIHDPARYPGAITTLTDILTNVVERWIAVNRPGGRAGQDVLRRVGEASVLILISLADVPKHGYALTQDIKELADVELGPGTLYGALDRLERLGLIESLPAESRRHPYRITAAGAAALRVHLDALERVSAAGRLRLRLGGI
jgi:DNA-binding PadR family transcriptional regulator